MVGKDDPEDPETMPRAGLRRTHEVVVLLAILALAAGLRFPRLDREGLWLDEVGTASYAVMPLGALVARAAAEDVHPPLYHVLLHFWIAPFGAGEAALRSFSSVLGLLGLVAVWWCGRAWATSAVGLAAAAMLACSPYHIYYSQEARSYTLLALVSAASFACLARLLQAPGPRAAALYTLATTLLVYTHVYALFVVVAQAIVALGAPGRRGRWPGLRWWLGCGVAVAVLFVPQILTTARQAGRFQRGGTSWILPPGLPELWATLVQFAGSPWALAVVGPLALLPFVLRGRTNGPAVVPGFGYALAVWFWLPILLPIAVSQVRAPIFLTRAAIAGLPALALAAAWGLFLLRPRAARIAVAAVVLGLSLFAQARYAGGLSREQWREAVSGIEAEAAPGDAVLLDAPYGLQAYAYYQRRRDLRVMGAAHDLASAAGPGALVGLTGEAGRIFVVRFQRREDHDGVARALPGYRLTGFHRHLGILVYRFERP